MVFSETIDATVFAGYVRQLQSANDAAFADIVQDLYKRVTEGELAGDAADWSASSSEPPRRTVDDVIEALVLNFTGTRYFRERIRRDDETQSGWSNTISENITAITQWRAVVLSNPFNDTGGFSTGQMAMFATIGGPDLCVGGTPFASGSASPTVWGADKAFDGVSSTHFSSDTPLNSGNVFLGYEFATSTPAIARISFTADDNTEGLNLYQWGPTQLQLQKFVGGVWTAVRSWGPSGGAWGLGETRNFDV